MNLIKKLIIKYRELIIYGLFGVGTTVVNFVAFKLFNTLLGEEQYLISNIFAWFVSVTFAFFSNKIFVFKSESWKFKPLFKEIVSFFSSRVFTFLIEEFGLYLLVDVVGLGAKEINLISLNISGEMISKAIVGVVVVIINYIFSKIFIFKKSK